MISDLISYTSSRRKSLLGIYARLSGGPDLSAIELVALAPAEGVDIDKFIADVLIPDINAHLVQGFILEYRGAMLALPCCVVVD